MDTITDKLVGLVKHANVYLCRGISYAGLEDYAREHYSMTGTQALCLIQDAVDAGLVEDRGIAGFWIVDRRRTCNHEICDGNVDDPEYAYCGLPFAHAGEHGNWQH